LRTLDLAGIAHAGAGGGAAETASAATLNVTGKGSDLVFSRSSPTRAIPWVCGAPVDRPGRNLLGDRSDASPSRLAGQILIQTPPGDVTVDPSHCGCNWGYNIPDEKFNLSHRLVDEGVSIVLGHSSHYVKPLEVYRGRISL